MNLSRWYKPFSIYNNVSTKLLTPFNKIPIKHKFTSKSTMNPNKIKAVIFDMGGVLTPSLLPFFKEYEQINNFPTDSLFKILFSNNSSGIFAQLERGEILSNEFDELFKRECASQGIEGLPGILSQLHLIEPRCDQKMMSAVNSIRENGIKTALLTNNWFISEGVSLCPVDKSLFDVVVESCKCGMRKPETRIYHHVLSKLNVLPNEALFLDDIGHNLKAAQALGVKTVKFVEVDQALGQLEKELGFSLTNNVPDTSQVPPHLLLPVDCLKKYLDDIFHLPLHVNELPLIRLFSHGQSNPTYYVEYANKKFVLRKKPPGKLLPSAHAIEREYRVMDAVSKCGVPIPHLISMCEDPNVIGTPFYLMEYVPGRIFKEPSLPGMSNEERRDVYLAMSSVLSKIHSVDIDAVGLSDFGKKGDYLKRNFLRWAKQYESSKTGEIDAFNNLLKWIPQNFPSNERTTVVHGDFRLDNLIFHPTKPVVLAVLDWELSTLGDPLTDLATNCLSYYLPSGLKPVSGFMELDIGSLGLPSMQQYIQQYMQRFPDIEYPMMDVYMAYVFFRFASICQGVYKRSQQGQASSSDASSLGQIAIGLAEAGWNIAINSKDSKHSQQSNHSNNHLDAVKNNSTATSASSNLFKLNSSEYSTSRDRDIPGALPLSVSALSDKARKLYSDLRTFMEENIYPLEPSFLIHHTDPNRKWTIHPDVPILKKKAKEVGLWNLFLPKESDPNLEFGAGLTNVEYAYMCEEMGRSPIAPEIFNCGAPDTGNIEVLVRYGTKQQKEKWLKPLLSGEIKSCFAMTEPDVASSDASNIESSIEKQGDYYIINGHKWWTSGAGDPRCSLCIFMGKTDKTASVYRQQSMILVPMDSPGVKIVRQLTVFGYDDAPHGHSEIIFENVKVPIDNLLLGEGRGFEIAQGRLGPGRIHHCMRLIGMAERSLELLCIRAEGRNAFGKPLAKQSVIQQQIAESRIDIEQSRLLVLKAAHMMDTVGNKVAAPEIAMIKVAAPNMAQRVIDRAIQVYGGMGMSNDTPLAAFFTWARVLRLADGPDEVHKQTISKMEFRAQNLSRL